MFLFAVGLSPAGADNIDRMPAPIPTPPPETRAFQWKPAIEQATRFLAVEHAFRMATEPGTRSELRGPFLRDYVASLKGLRGWGDGDPFIVNYVGHPFQGAVAGYIQVQNDPVYRNAEFSTSGPYWRSRFRAMAFSAVYSTQFELGPVSEAAFGNLGKNKVGAGAVDLVVTPLGGMGVMVAEDVLDRYVVAALENRIQQPVVRLLVRGFLNPNRSFANVLRGRLPWHRDNRGGVSQ
jgi:hypothetical protein